MVWVSPYDIYRDCRLPVQSEPKPPQNLTDPLPPIDLNLSMKNMTPENNSCLDDTGSYNFFNNENINNK